nr:putative capsid protein [Picobirnavirus sp.]
MRNKSFDPKSKPNTKKKGYKNRRKRRDVDIDSDSNSKSDINNLGGSLKYSPNDPAWYMHNVSLADNSRTIPFSYQLGTRLSGYDYKDYVMPGLCAMELVPAYGPALYKTDPINVASTQVYSYVRHANGGHSNYDSPDLMMYMLAMSQAYSCHEWLKRMFGYLNTYSVTNRYIPRAYAEADWIDFDDFIKNKANFHYFINEMAVTLTAHAIPQTLDLFKRHRFVYSNIYTDDISTRAALYMFTPAGFYKFDNTTSETGTSLQWSAWAHTGTKHTYSDLVAYVKDLLNKVYGDEDAGIMSGDIKKAYGTDSIFQAEAITLEYSVLPIYDPAMLSQIHNATVYDTIVPRPVDQTADRVIQNQQLCNVSELYPKETSGYAYLDTNLDNPSVADIFEMSRLVARKNTIAGRDDVVAIIGGSELVSYLRVYTFNYTNNNYEYKSIYGSGVHIGDAGRYRYLLQQLDRLSKFRNHPLIHVIDSGNSDAYQIYGDMDNVTTISWQQLDALHTTALLSLFGV